MKIKEFFLKLQIWYWLYRFLLLSKRLDRMEERLMEEE